MPSITLSLQSSKSSRAFGINFDAFNKTELEPFCKCLMNYLRLSTVSFSKDSSASCVKTCKLLLDKVYSAVKKPQLVEFLVSFYRDGDNMFKLIRSVAHEFEEVWRMLVRQEVTLAWIDKRVGNKLKVIKTNSWNACYLIHPLLVGANVIVTGYSWELKRENFNRYIVWIGAYVCKIAVSNLFATGALDPLLRSSLPKGTPVVNFEPDLVNEIPAMLAYSNANKLLGTSDTVSLAKVKAFVKKGIVREFEDYESESPVSRGALLGSMYVSLHLHNRMFSQKFSPDSITEITRYVTDLYPAEMGSAAFRTLLPYYQGITKAMLQGNRARLISAFIRSLLEPAHANWLSLANFRLMYATHDNLIDGNSRFTSLLSVMQYREYMIERSDVPVPPHSDYKPSFNPDLWRDITWFFVTSYIRLLIAAGCLEYARVKIENVGDEAGEYEGWLREGWVRLTPLGEFAFGLKKEYKAPNNLSLLEDLELDDRNRIITLLRPDSPAGIYLENYGRPIGTNRFHLSPVSILSKAADRADGIKRVENLRDLLKPAKGSTWDNLLKECDLRARCSRPDPSKFILVNLNQEVPGLIEFINNSSEIRSNVVRTEDARLLVRSGYYDEFCKTLRKAGYIL